MNLHRIRWAVRAVGGLAIAVSVFANILHAEDNPVSQGIAAWPPIALVLTVDLISRVPVHSRRMAWTRRGATAVIAGIAAWVSYWHMAAVASRYGETGASPYLLPLSVDGLVVVSFICLVELGGRIGAVVESTEGASRGDRLGEGRPEGERGDHGGGGKGGLPDGEGDAAAGGPAGGGDQAQGSEGPAREVAAAAVKLSRPRKPHTTNPERVARAWQKDPDASAADIARRLKLSPATVKRHRPADVDKVNGREPEFAASD